MPSEKKASEGIALLSMYGYEDDEMDDLDDGVQNRHEEDIIASPAPDAGAMKDEDYDNALNDNFSPSTWTVGSCFTLVVIRKSGGIEDDAVMISAEDQKAVDPLDKFLPPPPMAKCSQDLQVRIIKFIGLKTTGRSFNSEVQKKKEYRNPDFLLHAVTYQAIDQIGSCFPKDVFDPHGYSESDFYDELEADMRRREVERREQERKTTQKVDFASAGLPTPKINLPTPGLSTMGGVINATPACSDVTARDGRQKKKSKWDKVDFEQDSLAVVGAAHAALISAAKAGSGYSAFVQQRRKEAEDKRSSDKRMERRS
ncbi:hypothetical protein CASFOL_014341 [Castilleja foliolosa]|uniref:SAP30-binding protein n=1 Tax=Castilleja foliolosa TaxID=1961234 RepID=A0ABD3DRP2_9LAMI